MVDEYGPWSMLKQFASNRQFCLRVKGSAFSMIQSVVCQNGWLVGWLYWGLTTFLTCFCRGERRKYTGKRVRLNRESNSQPPGHECDTLTTEPPGRGLDKMDFLGSINNYDMASSSLV